MDFFIEHFADYHDIEDKRGYKALELGCFPTKGFIYNHYYGVFYRGRKPSVRKILDYLNKINIILLDPNADEDQVLGPGIAMRPEWVREEIKEAMG